MYKLFKYVLWVVSLSISSSVCQSWIIYLFSTVKLGAKQNLAQPPSGFLHCISQTKITIFQSLLPCPTLISQCNWISVTCTLQVCAQPCKVYWILQVRRMTLWYPPLAQSFCQVLWKSVEIWVHTVSTVISKPKEGKYTKGNNSLPLSESVRAPHS